VENSAKGGISGEGVENSGRCGISGRENSRDRGISGARLPMVVGRAGAAPRHVRPSTQPSRNRR
jgi:hypothetical protein